MVRRAPFVIYLFLLAAPAVARPPRPQLTPEALALLKGGAVFVVPEDNLAVPLAGKAKPVPFLTPAPTRLEIVATGAEPLLVVDEDLYRLKAGALSQVAPRVGKMPDASPDGSVVAGIEDKRVLKISRAGAPPQLVKYRRAGNWELEHPWVTPDGSKILVVVRDYTQPLEVFQFLVVDAKSGEIQETALSKNFIPGPLRHPVSATQVAIQVMPQTSDEDMTTQTPTDLVVFDVAAKKLVPAAKDLRPGIVSPDGRLSIVEGRMRYSDDKRCGGDETLVYERGKPKPWSYSAASNEVVSVLDFVPDGTLAIANVTTLKGCKNRGVMIPTKGNDKPSTWKPLATPTHPGRIQGRVIALPSAP